MPDDSANDTAPALTHAELALLAHELRGALTVVVGLSDLLGRGLTSSEQIAALGGINRAVVRADALIAAALEGNAAPRAGTSTLVDLAALSREVVADQHAITGRDVSLEEWATPIVVGDSNALGRALSNLLDNALKYSPADSQIEVSVSVAGALAVIEVADRGPGIPEAHRAAAFEPFERLGREGEEPGSGLGLAVVRSIAESHGGSASALPREGGGTIMRLALPLAAD